MSRFVFGVLLTIGNVLFFVPQIGLAQTTLIDRSNQPQISHWLVHQVSAGLSAKAVTKPGGLVASFPCDPLMSSQQEAKILHGLSQVTTLDWDGELPLDQFAQELSRYFPVRLDVRSLQEIGLDSDTLVVDHLFTRLPTKTNVSPTPPAKWWDAKNQGHSDSNRRLLVVQIVTCLRPIDLTLVIRHGEVVITTEEAAEDDLAVRVYDVTPLVRIEVEQNRSQIDEGRYLPPTYAPNVNFDSLTSLIEQTIEPDTWEALGGNSTIGVSAVRDKQMLIISSTSMNHWRIQRLLDRLNQ